MEERRGTAVMSPKTTSEIAAGLGSRENQMDVLGTFWREIYRVKDSTTGGFDRVASLQWKSALLTVQCALELRRKRQPGRVAQQGSRESKPSRERLPRVGHSEV